jgi:hypothetical protein
MQDVIDDPGFRDYFGMVDAAVNVHVGLLVG